MGPFHINIASSLATFLPKLKVLSLRCSMLYKDALILNLDRLQHLEVLNMSHCFLVEGPPPCDVDDAVRYRVVFIIRLLGYVSL